VVLSRVLSGAVSTWTAVDLDGWLKGFLIGARMWRGTRKDLRASSQLPLEFHVRVLLDVSWCCMAPPYLEEEDFMEFDLEDGEDQGQEKALTIAHFFSSKRFNARDMFEEMCVAWGLQSLKPV
jgi:hypothetical protein